MKHLVEDLLMLARADAGKLQLQILPVDLKQIVEDCAAMLEPLAAERDICINVSGNKTIVHGDPDRLTQLYDEFADQRNFL